MKRLFGLVIAAALIAAPLRLPAALDAATAAVYADALGAGWIDWTENITHNLAAGPPVHSGSHSISVAFAHWEGLYLHHPGLDTGGYMQRQLYATGSPTPDNPAAYPVALNVGGYPDNLAGFGRRMVDVIHTAAPNALVAPHASMWATNDDIQTLSVPQVISDARRTAAFIDAMGGDRADALAAEWSVRDSGYDPVHYPFWDDTNQALPRHSRAVLWDNALSTAAHKRLILWQMPCGNMGLDNTCHRYRDNRAAYVFRHAADLRAAGVFGVLFGGDTTLPCITQPDTDGGFIRVQAALFYGVLDLSPSAFLPSVVRDH